MSRFFRRGTSLLEVMIASGVAVTAIVILVEIQAAAVRASINAEDVTIGTGLCQEKLSEALLSLETDGLASDDVYEHGDFSDFGDELDLDFGDNLSQFHWEYQIYPIEINLGGDLMGNAEALGGDMGGGSDNGQDPMAGLEAAGMGGDFISDELGKFIREVRVRVWWGDTAKKSEEQGRQCEVVTHVISTSGAFQAMDQAVQQRGGGN